MTPHHSHSSCPSGWHIYTIVRRHAGTIHLHGHAVLVQWPMLPSRPYNYKGLDCRLDHQTEPIQFRRNTCVQATSLTMLVRQHSFLDIQIGDITLPNTTVDWPSPIAGRMRCSVFSTLPLVKIRLVLQFFNLQTSAKHWISEIILLHDCQHKETTISTVHHA